MTELLTVAASPSRNAADRIVVRDKRRLLGTAALLAILCGASGAVALLGYYGFHAVAAQMLVVGWWRILLIAAIQTAILAVTGVAWWLLMLRPVHSPWPVIGARLIREAGSELLPFSALGGYLMSARALAAQRAWDGSALAALIVDVTLEIGAQIVFAVLALGILAWIDWHSAMIGPAALGVLAIFAGTAIAYLMQRRKIDLFGRVARPLVGDLLAREQTHTGLMQSQINAVYRHRWRPIVNFLLHLGCWIASAAEIWLALRFMGASLDVGAAIALEGLLSAVNGAAFFVPNAIGIQEGAYVALGAVLGLDADSALALSILKRTRDLIIGLPSLLLWQGLEGRRLWRRRMRWFRRAGDMSPP